MGAHKHNMTTESASSWSQELAVPRNCGLPGTSKVTIVKKETDSREASQLDFQEG